MENGIDVDAWRKRVRDDTFANYHVQMGLALQETGDAGAAGVAFERALAIVPDHALALYGLVTGLRRLGRAAEADAVHRKALACAPDYQADALLEYGRDLVLKERSAEAWCVFAELVAIKPDSREAQAYLGYAGLAEGRRTVAEIQPIASGTLDPEHAEILGYPYLRLAQRFAREQRVPEMMGAFEQALALRPFFVQHLYDIGMVYWATGHLERLATVFEELAHRDEDQILVLNSLGQVLLVLGRIEEALAVHRRALSLDGRDLLALASIGNLLQAKGCLDEADAWYRRASEIVPGNPFLLSNRGLVALALGRSEEALALQHEVIRILPAAQDNAWLGTNIALVNQRIGLKDAALAGHRRAIAAEPHLLGFSARLRPWVLDELTAVYKTLGFDPADLATVSARVTMR